MDKIVLFFQENVFPQLEANFEELNGFFSDFFNVIADLFKGIDWEGIFGGIFAKPE